MGSTWANDPDYRKPRGPNETKVKCVKTEHQEVQTTPRGPNDTKVGSQTPRRAQQNQSSNLLIALNCVAVAGSVGGAVAGGVMSRSSSKRQERSFRKRWGVFGMAVVAHCLMGGWTSVTFPEGDPLWLIGVLQLLCGLVFLFACFCGCWCESQFNDDGQPNEDGQPKEDDRRQQREWQPEESFIRRSRSSVTVV